MTIPLEFALHDPDITSRKALKTKEQDDERKPRIFDCKQRQIGVDVEALNLQVQEKKLRTLAEKEESRKYEIYNDVLYREEQAMKEKERWERRFSIEQLQNYWKIHQRKEFSRDFDLNDPYYLRKSLPICTGDNDPRIKSKGSLLRFDGEDYDGLKQMKKSSKLRQVLEDQINEKEELKMCVKLADKEWVNEATVESQFNLKCTELEERMRKEEIRQIQAYNLILAKQKQNEKTWEQKRSNSDDLAHIYNCLTSSFFLDKNKGLSPEQLHEIKEIQKLQILEQEQIKESEQARENYFVSLSAVNGRNDQKIANNKELKRKDELLKIRNINRLLAIEQLQRRKDLDREALNSNPTDEFYAQFNKTAK